MGQACAFHVPVRCQSHCTSHVSGQDLTDDCNIRLPTWGNICLALFSSSLPHPSFHLSDSYSSFRCQLRRHFSWKPSWNVSSSQITSARFHLVPSLSNWLMACLPYHPLGDRDHNFLCNLCLVPNLGPHIAPWVWGYKITILQPVTFLHRHHFTPNLEISGFNFGCGLRV